MGGETVELAPKVATPPSVAILLCTYQGQDYLAEQLASYEAQTHRRWVVHASDDGSTDDTLPLLEAWRAYRPAGQVSLWHGPRKGYAANFMSLAAHPDIHADYFAYSDQDDIWEPNKLERALKWLTTVPADVPALYCSRSTLVDASDRPIGVSVPISRPVSFANALAQNVAGGNTMVFNQAARALLAATQPFAPDIPHDWWTYMVVAGCGGEVSVDDAATIRYRQHERNLIGYVNSTWVANLRRINRFWSGSAREWNRRSVAALGQLNGWLTPGNATILKFFVQARQAGVLSRLIGLKRSGVYRQTLFGNIGLWAAAVLRKI